MLFEEWKSVLSPKVFANHSGRLCPKRFEGLK
jgi:hypothetical protein